MTDFPRIARPEQVGYSFDQLDRDFARTMRPDAETIPGRDDLDPNDFIRPDGKYDFSPLNQPDDAMQAHVDAWRRNRRAK